MGITREEFLQYSKNYTIIPVWRELVADLVTPVAAFARVVGNGSGFLLESVENGERWSRWSFVGRNPLLTISKSDEEIFVEGNISIPVETENGILELVQSLQEVLVTPKIDALPPMYSGLIGYLGYDIVREIERLPTAPKNDLDLPEAIMSIIGELAVFDHWSQRVFLIANAIVAPESTEAEVEAAYEEALTRLEQLTQDGAKPLTEPLLEPPLLDDDLPEVQSTMEEDEFCLAVETAKEHILAGDIFQVVLSRRFDFKLNADPFDVYRVLRQINPSPYMYFVRQKGVTLVGCSPEPLVQLRGGKVTSRPIAGTRKRGETEIEDRKLASELQEDPKELAEHVMLVDLARNDIGRIAEYGTLEMDEMMTLEFYSHVMHLTSQVSAVLAKDLSPVDVLKATFPAGTVSGAPKVRAMQIIDDLEKTKRGPYAGVVGYLDFSGNLDNAIAIRTMVITGDSASVQAGAGIVADSEPINEFQECWAKAKALLSAVRPAEKMTLMRKSGI
ncbi:MAG TPA: anthranilate synthase component I [Acidimicrobiales bacterium]|jgi:anthranilate synthase component 1|nr:anthranilate synthase component I [Acidimicrobiales bacterium]HJM27863.1 anthranilate synthase component I [Acidimicrobiales bacterium]HJM97820.1 anthranilate synthase component I [Acidimicrobiales bacterium]